jgi:hypothetical protein
MTCSLSDKTHYQSIVGNLIYLPNSTRPDIQHSTGLLCKYMQTSREAHLSAAKRFLRYLKQTINAGITIVKRPTASILEVYADADFANDENTSKSVSGVLVLHHGNPVKWTSRVQQTVAASTTEAEILAVKEGTQDTVYFQNLIIELSPSAQIRPTTIFNDNVSAIKTLEGGGRPSANRHYTIRINFIRDYIKNGCVTVTHKRTGDMLADGLTKTLEKEKHLHLFWLCGLAWD